MKGVTLMKNPKQLTPLTEKEKAVLEFIETYQIDQGISPSYQEIKDHFGFASFNSVQNYLKQLCNKGYISIPTHQKRAIQVLHSALAVQKLSQERRLQEKEKRSPSEDSLLPPSDGDFPSHVPLRRAEESFSIPLLGKVAAGRPIEAMTHHESIDVPPSMLRNPDKSFALKVAGQSMIDDGILDGDIILVQKQNSVSNGEIVVATVEQESTVKRFYLRTKPDSSSARKMIELRPANSEMKSMWFDPDEVQLQGVVVGLMRKF